MHQEQCVGTQPSSAPAHVNNDKIAQALYEVPIPLPLPEIPSVELGRSALRTEQAWKSFLDRLEHLCRNGVVASPLGLDPLSPSLLQKLIHLRLEGNKEVLATWTELSEHIEDHQRMMMQLSQRAAEEARLYAHKAFSRASWLYSSQVVLNIVMAGVAIGLPIVSMPTLEAAGLACGVSAIAGAAVGVYRHSVEHQSLPESLWDGVRSFNAASGLICTVSLLLSFAGVASSSLLQSAIQSEPNTVRFVLEGVQCATTLVYAVVNIPVALAETSSQEHTYDHLQWENSLKSQQLGLKSLQDGSLDWIKTQQRCVRDMQRMLQQEHRGRQRILMKI
jgi:hypothetical protein